MNCPNCGAEVIWGSDIDIDTDLETNRVIPLIKNKECILSFYTCPDCPTEIEVYYYVEPV